MFVIKDTRINRNYDVNKLKIKKITSKSNTRTKSKKILKSFRIFLKLFFNESAIHGFSYFMRNNLMLIERVFWIFLVICAFYSCTLISLESLKRYRTKSTVISLEKDYYYWNTSLSSITICPMQRLSQNKFENYCKQKNIHGNDKNELWNFLESLANSTYDNFQNIKEYDSVDKLNINPNDYMQLIYNLTDDLTRLENSKQRVGTVNDEDIIHTQQILTEYGICYVTNSFLSEYISASYLIMDKYPKQNPYEFSTEYSLHMVRFGNIFDTEIIYSIIGFTGAISIFIHSPYEVMDIDKGVRYSAEPYEFETNSIEIITADNFERDTTISQRHCRFMSESNLTHYKVYTKNLCLHECRLNLAYKLCECIPHFYPNLISNPKKVCNYKILKTCFIENKKKFHEIGRQRTETTDCYCLQNCKESKVSIEKQQVMKDSEDLLDGLGAMVTIKKYPLIRFKRQILFTYNDLLISIGGTAGLFLGFSVLGAIEILYFFTLRLFWYLKGYK